MPTADPITIQDVDALLAEADALMGEVQSSLSADPDEAQSEESTAESPAADEVQEIDADVMEGMEEVIATSEQPDSTPATSDAITSTAAASTDAAPTAVSTPAANPAAFDAPRAAPADWVNEAELSQGEIGEIEKLPELSETKAAEESGASVEETEAAPTFRNAATAGLGRAARRLVHLPIDILIVVDLPFAGLGSNMKNIIGFAAVGTLLVAIGTLVAGRSLIGHG